MRFARLVTPDVRTLLRDNPEELRDVLPEFHPADLGDLLAQVEPEEASQIVRLIPEEQRARGKTTYRSLTIEGEEVEFSDGFADLHTAVYRDILSGGGFGIEDARPSVALAHDIREAPVVRAEGDMAHPFIARTRQG